MILQPGLRRGTVSVPVSKSHLHRLLIAGFLAGDRSRLDDEPGDSDDIRATRRCLRALGSADAAPVLDCGESGSTLRFLAPVAAALGKRPVYRTAGRLAERPMVRYDVLRSGLHELRGDVSSQFVTGLLFALPLLEGESEIRFLTPLESRGYVDMTLQVLADAGIRIDETPFGFRIAGPQRYRAQIGAAPEGDWSGAAFWYAMDALGSEVRVDGLRADSAQPDRAVVPLLSRIAETAPRDIDVSQSPDLFPSLAVTAACFPKMTRFTGTRRLRLKECDRAAAMQDVLRHFGVEACAAENEFLVSGTAEPLSAGTFATYGDHRIAMAVAVGATRANGPVDIDNAACVAKSYPGFFEEFTRLALPLP